METESTLINRLSRIERDTKIRLTRIESKLVRGFEELGISTDTNSDWLTVDDEARIVYVDTIGRSLMVLFADMSRKGATHFGDNYEVVHKGTTVAVVELRRVI